MDERMPTRIFIVEPRGAGGMIHYAYQLCTALAKEGADVTLVTAREYELESLSHIFKVERLLNMWHPWDPRLANPPRNTIERLGRKVHWSVRRGFRAARLVLSWIRLDAYLIRQRPDIVQFGEIDFPFEFIFLQYLKRRRLLLADICHEFESRESTSLFARIRDRLSTANFRSFSAIFLHGESNLKKFTSLYKIPVERVHLIVHGNEQIFPAPRDIETASTEMRHRYGIESQNPVVLFFGSLTPSKGVPDLIKAFASVYERNKKARLIIAGMPTKYVDMSAILNLVTELKLDDTVIFDSRYLSLWEVGPLVHLARVVVLPYLNSSQSGAVQVAYAFGRPVVATTVGAFSEDVEEGRSGFLVPPESPEQLADAIIKFVDDPELSQTMGEYARHLSETKYSWQPNAQSILSVYRKLLDENKVGKND
jgi:glycosyltransferase involved in cell wall biosynthesis